MTFAVFHAHNNHTSVPLAASISTPADVVALRVGAKSIVSIVAEPVTLKLSVTFTQPVPNQDNSKAIFASLPIAYTNALPCPALLHSTATQL